MVLSREDFLQVLNRRISGSDEESLQDIENLVETFDANRGYTIEDIETAVAEKENEWRERYRTRFFEGSADNEQNAVLESGSADTNNVTFDDLFITDKED